MAVFVRTKRVTDPFDDKVKACICGRDHRQTSLISSGSKHNVEESPCLSDLVHGFFEEETGVQTLEDSTDSDRDRSISELTDVIEDLLNPSVINDGDSFRSLLNSHVSKAVEIFSCFSTNKVVFRRKVMLYLRESGHNAGICKTKWESLGGLTAGNYEFIDVVRSDVATCQQRYFVDIGFAAQFEIARPTAQYERLLEVLPRVYVGRSDDLKQVVRVMCDAAKKSLKNRDLSLPPWRKNRYMQNKWFGPHRRTLNPISSTTTLPSEFDKFTVKCRSVGFDAVTGGNGRLIFPAATRIR